MNTTTARLTAIEQAVAKLVDRRGDKVSDLLKAARTRSQRGEVAPILYDVDALEREAALSGLRGAMARARLRALLGVPPGALLPVRVSAKDGRSEGEGCLDASQPTTRPTGRTVPATAASVSGALVDRIDQLLARHA